MKEIVFEKFGRGGQNNRYIEKYFWSGKITGMLLEYNEVLEKGKLYMGSEKITKQLEIYRKQKAKEGAEKEF